MWEDTKSSQLSVNSQNSGWSTNRPHQHSSTEPSHLYFEIRPLQLWAAAAFQKYEHNLVKEEEKPYKQFKKMSLKPKCAV